MWRLADDPRRCDFLPTVEELSSVVASNATPPASRVLEEELSSVVASNATPHASSDATVSSENESASNGVPLITAPVTRTPLHELSRREPFNAARILAQRSGYYIEPLVDVDVTGARDFIAIQDKWDEMLQFCKQRYSAAFWKFFLKLHTFSQVVVDTALHNVTKMFFFPSELKRYFPSSRRQMMSHLGCIKQFWTIVRHTCRIDVSQFDLQSGTTFLDFQFIDPIWGWLLAARRQNPVDLHWRPFAQHRTSEPIYGGGIQYGECFKHAFITRPEGSHLMMMGLHWDGTYGRNLDVTPIAVAVANVNNCDKSKETCIGYMPFTPDQKRPEFLKTEKSTR